MLIIRKYKNLGWFDFLERIERELKENPSKVLYIEFVDEIRMRKLESLSEGGTYKLKAPAQDILKKFKIRMEKEKTFASAQDLSELRELVSFVL